MTNEISTHTPINLEEVAVMAKMPANQTYLSLPDDPDCDNDDAKIEVRRDGPSVLVYVGRGRRRTAGTHQGAFSSRNGCPRVPQCDPEVFADEA